MDLRLRLDPATPQRIEVNSFFDVFVEINPNDQPVDDLAVVVNFDANRLTVPGSGAGNAANPTPVLAGTICVPQTGQVRCTNNNVAGTTGFTRLATVRFQGTKIGPTNLQFAAPPATKAEFQGAPVLALPLPGPTIVKINGIVDVEITVNLQINPFGGKDSFKAEFLQGGVVKFQARFAQIAPTNAAAKQYTLLMAGVPTDSYEVRVRTWVRERPQAIGPCNIVKNGA